MKFIKAIRLSYTPLARMRARASSVFQPHWHKRLVSAFSVIRCLIGIFLHFGSAGLQIGSSSSALMPRGSI